VISSDFEELLACDRVLVMHQGRMVDELVGAAITEDRMLRAAYEAVPPETPTLHPTGATPDDNHGLAENTRPSAGLMIARVASKYGTVIALLLLILAFGVLKGDLFLTSGNFVDIASDVAIGAIIACGLTVPLIANEFDLSIGYVASFAGSL